MKECNGCKLDLICGNCKVSICKKCAYWIDKVSYCWKSPCYDTNVGDKVQFRELPVVQDPPNIDTIMIQLKEDLIPSIPTPKEKFSKPGVRDSCSECGHYLQENPETVKEKIQSIRFPLHYHYYGANGCWEILDADNRKILEPNVGADDECKVKFLVARLNLAENLVKLFQSQELK